MTLLPRDMSSSALYTLPLPVALPILLNGASISGTPSPGDYALFQLTATVTDANGELLQQTLPLERYGKPLDRKSTRLNSSHGYISYAVVCLKKKESQPCAKDATDDSN